MPSIARAVRGAASSRTRGARDFARSAVGVSFFKRAAGNIGQSIKDLDARALGSDLADMAALIRALPEQAISNIENAISGNRYLQDFVEHFKVYIGTKGETSAKALAQASDALASAIRSRFPGVPHDAVRNAVQELIIGAKSATKSFGLTSDIKRNSSGHIQGADFKLSPGSSYFTSALKQQVKSRGFRDVKGNVKRAAKATGRYGTSNVKSGVRGALFEAAKAGVGSVASRSKNDAKKNIAERARKRKGR